MGRSRAACGMRYRHLKNQPAKPSRAFGSYGERNRRLKDYGFDSYQDYLQSEIWKAIREDALNRNKHCILCATRATQVHHICYHPQVLFGNAPSLLVSLCGSCHHSIEFDGEMKRNLYSCTHELLNRLRASGRQSLADSLSWDLRKVIKSNRRKERKENRQRKANGEQAVSYRI